MDSKVLRPVFVPAHRCSDPTAVHITRLPPLPATKPILALQRCGGDTGHGNSAGLAEWLRRKI